MATTLYELEAVLKLNTQQYESQAKEAIKQGEEIGESISGAGKDANSSGLVNFAKTFATALGTYGGAKLVSALFDFSQQSIKLASDLEEVQNVVDVVFGTQGAAQLEMWAEEMKYTAGMGELTAKTYASTFGAVFAGAGAEGDALQEMSTNMTQLVGDMASFYNLSHDEAFSKVMSFFAGQTRPLRDIGIDASVAQLERYAESIGLVWKELDDTGKQQLRYNFLLDKTGLAQGDFERTAGSYANQMRLMEENMQSLSVNFGEWLLQAVTPAVALVNKMFEEAEYIGKYITGADEQEQSQLELLAQQQLEAETAINVLKRLHGVTGKTAAEEEAYAQAMQKIIDLYPELGDVIDVENRTISGGLGAVEALVSERQKLLDIEVRREALAQKQQILDEANNNVTQKRVDLINAEEEARAKQQAAIEALQQAYEMSGMSSQYGTFEDFFASMNTEGLANAAFYDATNDVWKNVEHAILTTLAAEYEHTSGAEQDAYQNITDEVASTSEAAEAAVASIAGFETALEDAKTEAEIAADAVDMASRRFAELTGESYAAEASQQSIEAQNRRTALSFREAATAVSQYESALSNLPTFGKPGLPSLPQSNATRSMTNAQSGFGMTPGDVQNAVQAALAAWATPVGGEEYAVIVSKQMAHGMRGKR